MHNLLERLIGENIELVSVLKPDLGLTKIDPSQFEQVLINLVVNGRDAILERGSITIETKNMRGPFHQLPQTAPEVTYSVFLY